MRRPILLTITGVLVLVAAAVIAEISVHDEDLSVVSSVANSGRDARLGPGRATVLGSNKLLVLAGGSLSCPPVVATADLSGTTLILGERSEHMSCTADYGLYSIVLTINQPIFVGRDVNRLRWSEGSTSLPINR